MSSIVEIINCDMLTIDNLLIIIGAKEHYFEELQTTHAA
jgi:hypothetical protein